MWTVHASQRVDTPPRGRNGSTSSGGLPTQVRGGGGTGELLPDIYQRLRNLRKSSIRGLRKKLLRSTR